MFAISLLYVTALGGNQCSAVTSTFETCVEEATRPERTANRLVLGSLGNHELMQVQLRSALWDEPSRPSCERCAAHAYANGMSTTRSGCPNCDCGDGIRICGCVHCSNTEPAPIPGRCSTNDQYKIHQPEVGWSQETPPHCDADGYENSCNGGCYNQAVAESQVCGQTNLDRFCSAVGTGLQTVFGSSWFKTITCNALGSVGIAVCSAAALTFFETGPGALAIETTCVSAVVEGVSTFCSGAIDAANASIQWETTCKNRLANWFPCDQQRRLLALLASRSELSAALQSAMLRALPPLEVNTMLQVQADPGRPIPVLRAEQDCTNAEDYQLDEPTIGWSEEQIPSCGWFKSTSCNGGCYNTRRAQNAVCGRIETFCSATRRILEGGSRSSFARTIICNSLGATGVAACTSIATLIAEFPPAAIALEGACVSAVVETTADYCSAGIDSAVDQVNWQDWQNTCNSRLQSWYPCDQARQLALKTLTAKTTNVDLQVVQLRTGEWDDRSRGRCVRCAAHAFAHGTTTQNACYSCNCGDGIRICGCINCNNEPAPIESHGECTETNDYQLDNQRIGWSEEGMPTCGDGKTTSCNGGCFATSTAQSAVCSRVDTFCSVTRQILEAGSRSNFARTIMCNALGATGIAACTTIATLIAEFPPAAMGLEGACVSAVVEATADYCSTGIDAAVTWLDWEETCKSRLQTWWPCEQQQQELLALLKSADRSALTAILKEVEGTSLQYPEWEDDVDGGEDQETWATTARCGCMPEDEGQLQCYAMTNQDGAKRTYSDVSANCA